MGMCCISFCCPVYFCGGGITAASTRLCCNKNLGKEKFPSCCQLTNAICLFFGLIMYIIVTIECTNAESDRQIIDYTVCNGTKYMGYYHPLTICETHNATNWETGATFNTTSCHQGLGPGCKQYFKPHPFYWSAWPADYSGTRCFSYRGGYNFALEGMCAALFLGIGFSFGFWLLIDRFLLKEVVTPQQQWMQQQPQFQQGVQMQTIQGTVVTQHPVAISIVQEGNGKPAV